MYVYTCPPPSPSPFLTNLSPTHFLSFISRQLHTCRLGLAYMYGVLALISWRYTYCYYRLQLYPYYMCYPVHTWYNIYMYVLLACPVYKRRFTWRPTPQPFHWSLLVRASQNSTGHCPGHGVPPLPRGLSPWSVFQGMSIMWLAHVLGMLTMNVKGKTPRSVM